MNAGTRLRKGKFFHDVMTQAEADESVRYFDLVGTSRQVDWRRGPSVLEYLEHIAYLERAFCPMASDGERVDLMLCMTLFYGTDGRIY